MPFYAILRSITFNFLGLEAKFLGVLAMFGAIGMPLHLPWLDRSPVRSLRYRPLMRFFFVLFVVDCFALGFVGANPPEGAWILIGQAATAYYFIHF